MSKKKAYNVDVQSLDKDGHIVETTIALPGNGGVFKFMPPKDSDAAQDIITEDWVIDLTKEPDKQDM